MTAVICPSCSCPVAVPAPTIKPWAKIAGAIIAVLLAASTIGGLTLLTETIWRAVL